MIFIDNRINAGIPIINAKHINAWIPTKEYSVFSRNTNPMAEMRNGTK